MCQKQQLGGFGGDGGRVTSSLATSRIGGMDYSVRGVLSRAAFDS
jgi:hypothetical protein